MKRVTSINAVKSWNRKNLPLARRIATVTAILSTLANIHAGTAPPHNISAMNLNVVQNDTGNTVDSVTVTANISINDMRVRVGSNRGDYNLQIGETGTNDLADGM